MCGPNDDMTNPANADSFQKAPGTTGLYLREDNAQIWHDTYQPIWHGRRPDGTEGLFYTYAAAERWIVGLGHDNRTR